MSSFGVQRKGFLLMALSPTGGRVAPLSPQPGEKFGGPVEGVHRLWTFSQPCTHHPTAGSTHPRGGGRLLGLNVSPQPQCDLLFFNQKEEGQCSWQNYSCQPQGGPCGGALPTLPQEVPPSLLLALWILGRQRGFWRRCESLGLCGMHRSSIVI